MTDIKEFAQRMAKERMPDMPDEWYAEEVERGVRLIAAYLAERVPVHQWRKRTDDRWFDASQEEAYSRVDQYYEARTLFTAPPEPAPQREGLVCDQCIDGSGWCENAVEDRYPCTCMTEAEPYQLLQEQLAATQARESRLREALAGLREHSLCPDTMVRLLDTPTDDSALMERLKEERERCAKVADELGVIGETVAGKIRSMT